MAAIDTFTSTPDSFGLAGAVLTPSASDIAGSPKAIVLLTAGNVTIVPAGNADGDTLAFVGLPAGYSPPYRVRRLTAATATVASVL